MLGSIDHDEQVRAALRAKQSGLVGSWGRVRPAATPAKRYQPTGLYIAQYISGLTKRLTISP